MIAMPVALGMLPNWSLGRQSLEKFFLEFFGAALLMTVAAVMHVYDAC
jgi:hypothetical protein